MILCKNWWKPCECLGTDQLCGAKQSCLDGGCGGKFLNGAQQATCQDKRRGCKCLPSPNMCPAKGSCDDCNGTWLNMQGACTTKHIDCPCVPGTLCGPKASCNDNGCAGQFLKSDPRVAKCMGNYKDCPCKPGVKQCGTTASCEDGGCAGEVINGEATCKVNYPGCQCIPSPKTKGYCEDGLICQANDCMGGTTGICGGTARWAGCKCTQKPPPDMAPWPDQYCVGLATLRSGDSSIYSVGYTRADRVRVQGDSSDRPPSICGSWVDGAQIQCNPRIQHLEWEPLCTGDYTVAAFKSRSCRTPCRDYDSNQGYGFDYCFYYGPAGASEQSIKRQLVCDRLMY